MLGKIMNVTKNGNVVRLLKSRNIKPLHQAISVRKICLQEYDKSGKPVNLLEEALKSWEKFKKIIGYKEPKTPRWHKNPKGRLFCSL